MPLARVQLNNVNRKRAYGIRGIQYTSPTNAQYNEPTSDVRRFKKKSLLLNKFDF